MRLGCCGSIHEADAIKQAGFDYLEINVKQVLRGDEPDDVWDLCAPDPATVPLPIEAAASLLLPQRPVIGPYRDVQILQQYMHRVTRRAARLGIKRLVFGSGAARVRPEEVDHQTAEDHLIEFCKLAGDACGEHGILLVIEHLNRGETNTLNRLSQVRAMVDHLAHPYVASLVDSYHFGLEREPDEALLDIGGSIRHVHVAEPVDRCEPGAHGQSKHAFDFQHFFCLLRKAGYDERITVEAKFTRPIAEVAPACVRMLRDAWERAGVSEG